MRKPGKLNPVARRIPGYNGVRINVWDYGGDGPRLLFAHCTGTHSRVWDPVIRRLDGRFNAIAVDSRGHGDSDKPAIPDAYVWKYSGLDLLAVVDAMKWDRPLRAVGHSAGAAHICYAELERPGTFGPVVLIDPIIAPPVEYPQPNPLAERARRRKHVFASRNAALARYKTRAAMSQWAPESLEAYVRYGFDDLADGTVRLKCPGPIEAAVYERGGSHDIFGRLDELTFDATLVTADGSDTRHFAELQRDRIPNVEFVDLTGASHFIPQEMPVEIARLILDRMA